MKLCALVFCFAALIPAGAVAQEKAPERQDGTFDGAGRGAGLGALAALPLGLAQMGSCDTGCDWQSTPGILLGWAMLGAMGGAAAGLAADLDAPARLSARVGAGSHVLTASGGEVDGDATTRVFALAVRLSRHVSVHAEYTRVGARFAAAPGAVPDEVLRNVVTEVPQSRPAGWTRGVESRRVDYVLSELIGVHARPWRRVQLELLGGIGVQGGEARDYYDAYRTVAAGWTEPVPGKYYVLDFESPKLGFVGGVDAEITIVRGLGVVPSFRYHGMGDGAASLAFGAGMHWRF